VAKAENESGFHEWVPRTRLAMSPEERFRHKLVTIGFHYAIMPQNPAMTFEAYLADLEATPPSVLRDRLLEAYAAICMTRDTQESLDEPVDWEEVLSSASNYVEFLKSRFGEEDTDE